MEFIIKEKTKRIYSNYKKNLYVNLLEHFKLEGFKNIKGQLDTNIGLTEIILNDNIKYKIFYVENISGWN